MPYSRQIPVLLLDIVYDRQIRRLRTIVQSSVLKL